MFSPNVETFGFRPTDTREESKSDVQTLNQNSFVDLILRQRSSPQELFILSQEIERLVSTCMISALNSGVLRDESFMPYMYIYTSTCYRVTLMVSKS